MAFNGKTVLSGDFFLKSFNARVLEFDDPAAGDADQVVMVFIQVAGFVTRLAVAEMTLLGDTALGKQLQGPVYGLSLIHISEPTRLLRRSRMPSSA